MNKKIIIIALLFLVFFFVLKSFLPLFLIIAAFFIIRRKKEPKIEQKPVQKPITPDTPNEELNKAVLSECIHLIKDDTQIRLSTDLRQFKNRNNVTSAEVITYMREQLPWEGNYERHLHLEEIIDSCNLTQKDICVIEKELEKYHLCPVRDLESKAIWEYQNEMIRNDTYKNIKDMIRDRKNTVKKLQLLGEYDRQFEEQLNSGFKDDLKSMTDNLRRADYDAWLKMKGFI